MRKKALLICSGLILTMLSGCGKDEKSKTSGNNSRPFNTIESSEITDTQTTEEISQTTENTTEDTTQTSEVTEEKTTTESEKISEDGYYLVKRIRDLGEFGGTSNYSYDFKNGEVSVDDLYYVDNLRHPEIDMLDSYGGSILYLFAPEDVCPLLTSYKSELWDEKIQFDDAGKLIFSKSLNLSDQSSVEYNYSYDSDGKCHSYGADDLYVDVYYGDNGKVNRYHMYGTEDYVDVSFSYDNQGRITKYSGNAWWNDKDVRFEYDDKNHIAYVYYNSFVRVFYYDDNGLCFKSVRDDGSQVILYDYIFVSRDGTIEKEYTSEEMETGFSGVVDSSKTEESVGDENTEEITTETSSGGGLPYDIQTWDDLKYWLAKAVIRKIYDEVGNRDEFIVRQCSFCRFNMDQNNDIYGLFIWVIYSDSGETKYACADTVSFGIDEHVRISFQPENYWRVYEALSSSDEEKRQPCYDKGFEDLEELDLDRIMEGIDSFSIEGYEFVYR